MELARTALRQASRLVRAESRAAWAELRPRVRNAGVGVALFGAAGVMALYGTAVLVALVVVLLALVLPAWAAALVVTVALLAAAAVLTLTGVRRVRRAGPMMPEWAVESIRADLRAITVAAQRRSRPAVDSTAQPGTSPTVDNTAGPHTGTGIATADPAGELRAGTATTPAVAQVVSPADRHPGRWVAVGAGAVAAGAAVGALWWRARRTPRRPAARAWRQVVDRFRR